MHGKKRVKVTDHIGTEEGVMCDIRMQTCTLNHTVLPMV